jgi:hypothetical protein
MLKFLGCLTIPVALPIGIFMWIGSQTFNRSTEKLAAGIFAYGWVPAMLILGVCCFFVPSVRLPTLVIFVTGLLALAALVQFSR